jgi:1-acyl-sn-glycerol-3-phosphate acyltransferase
MGTFFQKIYFFFKQRRLTLFLVFFLTLGVWIFLASRVKFLEDISAILPKDPKIEKLNQVFQDSRFMDRLVFMVNAKGEPEDAADSLVSVADRFIPLIDSAAKNYISKIDGRVDESVATDLFETIYNHLPVYLDDADYDSIKRMMEPERITQTLAQNLQTLSSPAGFALKQFIAKDPSGISFLGIKKIQRLQYDESFELYDGYVVTSDHRNLLFFITPRFPPSNTGENSTFLSITDNVIKEFNKTSDIGLRYFGATAVSAGNAKQLRTDSMLTQGITVLFIMLFLGFYFRQKRAPLLIFIPVVYGALFALAMVFLVKGSISVIALGTGSVILGIAVNYSLHVYNHFRHTGNMAEVIDHLAQPMTIGSFTTIGGFFCLEFVKSEMLKDLGLFAGFSLIGASLASLIFLPHFIRSKLSVKEKAEREGWIDRIAKLKPESNKWLVAIIFALTIFFAFWVNRAGFQSDLEEMNFMAPDLKASQQKLNEINKYALQSVYLVTQGKTLDQALRNNEVVNGKLRDLTKEAVVVRSSGVSSLIISDSLQQRRIAQWNSFWTRERKDSFLNNMLRSGKEIGFREQAFEPMRDLLNRSYTLVDSGAVAALKNSFLADYINEKHGKHTVVTLVKVVAGKKDQVYAAFENNARVTVLDKQYLSSRFVQIIQMDFSSIAWMTSILVFAVLLLMYGRIELTLISFIPMAMSWIWILGIMGIFHIEFNIINIIISALIFGLGDDYSLFIMDGLLQEYKTGRKSLSSYKSSIMLSAITTIAGLGVLIFAKHPALRSIAIISITGILCVVLMSQILIPFLFNILIGNRIKRGLYPWTFFGFLKSAFAFAYFIHWSIFFTAVGRVFAHLRVKEKGKLVYHKMLSVVTRSLVYVMANVKKRIINPGQEDFSKPAVIICNHSSSLDIVPLLMLHPKMLMFTNQRKWNAPFFGPVIRMADYFPAEEIENHIEKMKDRVKKGYSFIVFPEGTRSADGVVRRFHKGAFYLAEQLGIDILPIMIHGNDYTLHKKDTLLKDGELTLKILPRILPGDQRFGNGYVERAKRIGKYFRAEFSELRKEIETPHYFRNKLFYNYIYKGPVLEWYMRVKVRLEKDYQVFNDIIPRRAKILDAGCGYGFMSYMLAFASEQREVTGIDYDDEKIDTANHCFSRTERIRFEQADILNYTFDLYDVIIFADMLHYLPSNRQNGIIESAIAALNENGILIIREGDSEHKRHERTKTTELFSTRLLKFNKTEHELSFLSGSQIRNIADKYSMKLEVISDSALTSNTIYILKRN